MTDSEIPTEPTATAPTATDRAATSRRTFLVLAGSTAGAGLTAGGAVGSPGSSGGDGAVAASPPHGDVAHDAVDSARDERPAAAVAVETDPTTAAARAFTAGDVDALVASRPLLPDERERAAANAVDYERHELATAVATLRHPTSTWVDCLPTASLAETWGSDGVVETWAEAETDGGGADAATNAGGATAEPASDGAAIIRGVRAYQYADGYGGLGYYEPEDDWLAAGTGGGDDSQTPLVRLAYLYVDRGALGTAGIAGFVREFAARSDDRVGDVRYAAGAATGG